MPIENQDNALESLLRSAPLRTPSDRLDARMDAVFAERHSPSWRWRIVHHSGLHRLAIAAGIVIAISIGVRLSLPVKDKPVAVTAPVVASHPIRFEQDTSTVYDDGIIDSSGDSAYRQFRRRTVREIWYEDPATHAKLRVTVPVEQIAIEKVEMY